MVMNLNFLSSVSLGNQYLDNLLTASHCSLMYSSIFGFRRRKAPRPFLKGPYFEKTFRVQMLW